MTAEARTPAPRSSGPDGGLPPGSMTFLFTDIEGSSRLEQRVGTAGYAGLRARHRAILRAALSAHGGSERGTEGDSFFVVFRDPTDALAAAIDAQRALAGEPWPAEAPIRVRIGIHAGPVFMSDDDYVGIDINQAARIEAAAHGGQVVVSEAVRSALEGRLPAEVRLADLGTHRLKDFEPMRLHQVIAPGLSTEFPPLRSLESRLDTLPRQLTSFLGRSAEVAEIGVLLRSTRLLTLTGPGGTGKTRLAIAAAAASLDDFRDGAGWVPLAPIIDPELVTPAIAHGLAVRDSGVGDLIDAIADRIGTSELLLVLDNFEHVVTASPIVATLLTRCPGLGVIVTSRAVLHLAGEREYPVAPLAVPDPASLPTLAELGSNEAVALFVARAQAVRPDFALTAETARPVALICARLDGLPLAIELAAARIRVLTPTAIAARLEQSLGLLSGGGRDLPERQQTLRGAIAWSYDLLDPVERVYFTRLAVFAGGCSLGDAEAVSDPDRALGIDVLDALGSLVDKSLVRRADGPMEEPRFRMLQVIREYGLERLAEAGELEACNDRLCAVVVDLVRRAEPELIGVRSAEWLDRLEFEHDNIRGALRWAIAAGHIEDGLITAGRLWRFWHQRGHLGEGLAMTRELLASPGAGATPGRAKALNAAGGLAYWQNDFPTARGFYEEYLDLCRALGDRPGLAEAEYNLAFLSAIPGDYQDAIERYDAALAIWRETNDVGRIGAGLMGLALVRYLMREYEEADRLCERALEAARTAGDRYTEASVMGIRDRVALEQGDLDHAWEWAIEGMRLYAEAGDPTGIAMHLDDLGELALLDGDPSFALRLAGAAEGVREKIAGGAPPTLVQNTDYVASARSALPGPGAETAWAAGRALDRDAAIAEALESRRRPTGPSDAG